MKIARIGVLLDRETAERRNRYGLNVFQAYIGEILAHAGIGYEWLDNTSQLDISRFDVVLAVLTGNRSEDTGRLWSYAQSGGIVISYAGLQPLAAKLGCVQKPEVPVGYSVLNADWSDNRPLRFFASQPWQAPARTDIRQWGRITGSPDGPDCGSALQIFQVGQGTVERWAIDLPSLIVRLQQGQLPVIEDGIPAEDGTGALDEGILKADDQCQLDWGFDRRKTETGMPYFAHPYADLWREALLGHLLTTLTDRGMTVPLIDYWPDDTEQVAMISFDSDLNLDEAAWLTLDLLKEHQIVSTWCIIEPGFDPAVYVQVDEDGHELAFHYNALEQENGVWSEQEFARQLGWLQKAANVERITSNKNHYTRTEGWGELFRWCEAHHIQSDQTRGPSKKGNVGFLFGTCQPFFPISWADERNRLYDVLEIGFLTQDLCHPDLSDTSLIQPFLEQVHRVRGVAHFLFHQTHLLRLEAVRKAFGMLIAEAKRQRFEFWSGRQINDWHRQRRLVKAVGNCGEGGAIRIHAEAGLEDETLSRIVVWLPLLPGETPAAGQQQAVRYGKLCRRAEVITVMEKGMEMTAD